MDILRHLLFENPLTPCLVLGLVALGAGFFWSRTGSKRARTLAVACCGVAAALIIVAWAVETDHERVARTLWIMSDAASRGDAETLIAQISPEYEGGPHGKDGLAAVVRLGLSHIRATADEPDIRLEGGRATFTQTYCFSPAPKSRIVVPPQYQKFTWEGTLAPDPDGQWRLRSAIATKPERMTPADAARGLMKLVTQMP
jgi:hypothetical protein